MNKKLKYLILLILSISLIKYFYQAFVLSPFEVDQEFLSMEAWKIVRNKKFTLIGAPTSIGGIFIGPLYTYFVALFMVLTNFHPFSVSILSALFTAFMPLLIFYVSTKLFNKTTGIIAAALSAISISYLNIINIPPLVIPLACTSLLVFYCLSQLKKHPRALIYVSALSAISLNLHFTAIYLPIMTIFWLIINKQKVNRAIVKKSISIFLIILSPLILFELRHNFFIIKNLFSFLTTSSDLNSSIFTNMLKSLKLFLVVSGEQLVFNYQYNILTSTAFILLFSLLLYKNKTNPHMKLLSFWLIFPILLNGLYSGTLLPYYFILIQAPFFILSALVLVKLVKPGLKWLLIVLIFMSLVKSASWSTNINNGFSLNHKLKAFKYIVQKVDPSKANLSLNTEYARRGGLEYLRLYYGFDKHILDDRLTYTIISPISWHRMKSDINYGEFGVILP